MLKFKISVADALKRIGFGIYDAKKTGYISQDTIKKLMAEDTRVTLESLNRLCVLLDMELKDIITWEMSPEDKADREMALSGKSSRSLNKCNRPVAAGPQQPDHQ